MSESITRLASRVLVDYLDGRHLENLVPDLNAMAAVANLTAALAEQTQAYMDAAAASYAAQLALGSAAYGAGTEGLDLPLNALLGSGAFLDVEQLVARRVVTMDAAYQVLPGDFWLTFLLTTGGTRTYTLPAWSDMPDLVRPLIGKNRSGNALTIARTGSDTIDNAATSVSVPTGSSWEIYKSSTSGLWESRVFA